MSLSSQGAFLQHMTAPRGPIKAWKSWSSGNAEERPAQPVGSWHLLWLSTEPASTGTSCGIYRMDSTQQQQHPAPQSRVTAARPWSGSSRDVRGPRSPGEVWISSPAFPHACSASLKPPWSSHLLSTQLVIVCVTRGAVQHSNHIPSLG